MAAKKIENPEDHWPKKDWRHRFIKAYGEFGIVTLAASASGRGRTAIYEERKKNKTFAAAWEDAQEIAVDRLEAQAIKRATDRARPSDTVLIFLLKKWRPDKYDDKVRLEHTGADGEPIKIESDNLEELEAEAAALRAQVESLESDR